MSDYGERKCLVCGKVFEPVKPQQVCCSAKCQAERGKELSRKWAAKHRPSLLKLLEAQELRIVRLEKLVKELHGLETEDYANILGDQIEPELEPEPESEPEPDKIEQLMEQALPTLKECKRMRLKALNLPCGKRVECFEPKRCKQCPPGAKAISINDADVHVIGRKGFVKSARL